MTLTAKQENFCKAIALQEMNYSDAYRASYNAENMKDETINKRASELVEDREVTGRIKELKDKITKKAIQEYSKTKVDLLNELKAIQETDADSKVKIDCIKEQGKLLGYYVNLNKNENEGTIEDFLKKLEKK